MTEITYHTERLDHLGIVAGICDDIDLVEQIDRFVPAPRRLVSIGQGVKAVVINALGFVSRPLYLTPEFFANKPVDLLIGTGITSEMLNDDSLGHALDALFEAGLTEVFAQVASHALRKHGIEHRFIHVDTSSFHLHYVQQFREGELPYFVADSALYSEENLEALSEVKWVTRCSSRSETQQPAAPPRGERDRRAHRLRSTSEDVVGLAPRVARSAVRSVCASRLLPPESLDRRTGTHPVAGVPGTPGGAAGATAAPGEDRLQLSTLCSTVDTPPPS